MSLLVIRLSEIIGLTILHSLWQITLLWIVLFAVLRLCPKASSAVRYTIAISILMLSVLTTAATAVYEWQLHTTSEEFSALPNGTTQTMDIVYITVTQTLLYRIVDALNASVPTLAWLWCAGLVVMGARFGGSFFYVRTLRAQENIAAIPPVWEQELKRLSVALGLRCEVAIAISVRISSPLTLGSISPIILLPAGLLSGMSTTQIEAILVHELYHIKRFDYIVNICQALIEVLLFYHPAVWYINNIIREERENCCDDQTLAFCGDAITYARALTQIQEINTLSKPTFAMSATGPNPGNFSNRIKRLFNIYPNPAQARSKGIIAIGFLIVYLGFVLASANVSTAQPVEPEKKPMKTSVNDYNMVSNIFSDSIPDGKGITPQLAAGRKKFWPKGFNTGSGDTSKEIIIPGLGVAQGSVKLYAGGTPMNEGTDYVVDYTFGKVTILNNAILNSGKNIEVMYKQTDPLAFQNFGSIHSMDIQRADTTVKERTLDGCLQQVSLMLKMASMYRLPGGRFIFSKFQAEDSIQAVGSVHYFTFERQPTRFNGTLSLLRITKLDLIDTTDIETIKEEPIEEFTKGIAMQVFPNSTNSSLNISFTPARNNSRVKIVLVDSDGKVVKEITDSTYDNIPTALHVDVSSYKKGIYIVQINIDGAKSQQRVVVE